MLVKPVKPHHYPHNHCSVCEVHFVMRNVKYLGAQGCMGFLIKAGIHLKAVFTPPKIGLTEISRSRFKQYKNPTLITQIIVLGCFVNFLVIFRYI